MEQIRRTDGKELSKFGQIYITNEMGAVGVVVVNGMVTGSQNSTVSAEIFK